MWPSSASVSRLVCVTPRDNCLGKCWLIGTHEDIISQEMWCLYVESSSSFYVCILPEWWEIYEMQKLLKFRWLWLPARNCVRQGTGELKWPQMCIFIFGDIYILVGTEASRLGCWPIYHWNKWRKFHSSIQNVRFCTYENSRTHVIALEKIFLFKLLCLKRWPCFET